MFRSQVGYYFLCLNITRLKYNPDPPQCKNIAIQPYPLVYLLHGTFLQVIVIVESRQVIHVIIIALCIILIDGQSKLHETVDARGEGSWLVKAEPRREEACVIQEPDEILHSLVRLISISLHTKCRNYGVHRVDLHRLLGSHIGTLTRIAERLSLHDALHVGGPAVLPSDKAARAVGKAVGHDHLLNLVIKNFLHQLAQPLRLGLGLLKGLLSSSSSAISSPS